MKIKLILIFTVCMVLLVPSFLKAQDYREKASVSPVEIYREMLSCVQTKNTGRILKLLGSVEGILEAINTNFGKDIKSKIEEAVSTGKSEDIAGAIHTLIYYDIKDVFKATMGGVSEGLSLAKLKGRVKFAYLDYLLVSPQAKRKNFNLDRAIRKGFADILIADLAKAVLQGNTYVVQSRFDSIEHNYKNIFGL